LDSDTPVAFEPKFSHVIPVGKNVRGGKQSNDSFLADLDTLGGGVLFLLPSHLLKDSASTV
jgi:hypothetical protein